MESNLEILVVDNIGSFEMYHDVIHDNNNNIQKIREDLGLV